MDYNIDEQPEEEQNFKAKYFKYKSKYLALKKQQEGGGHANAAGGRYSKTVEETATDFKTIIKEYTSQLTQLK